MWLTFSRGSLSLFGTRLVTGSPRLAFLGMSSGNSNPSSGYRWWSGRPRLLRRRLRSANFKVSACKLISSWPYMPTPPHTASIVALRFVTVYRSLCFSMLSTFPMFSIHPALRFGNRPPSIASPSVYPLSVPIVLDSSHSLSPFRNHYQVIPPHHTRALHPCLSFSVFSPFTNT